MRRILSVRKMLPQHLALRITYFKVWLVTGDTPEHVFEASWMAPPSPVFLFLPLLLLKALCLSF